MHANVIKDTAPRSQACKGAKHNYTWYAIWYIQKYICIYIFKIENIKHIHFHAERVYTVLHYI